MDNTLGAFEAESPRAPFILSDSAHVASDGGLAQGTSLDGIALGNASPRLPGAYQQRTPLSLPRRTTITLGENMCGGSACDVNKGFDNELQYAVWSAWPGSTVEIYPSASPYAGTATISWPLTVRGTGADAQAVVLRRLIEDSFLDGHGVWSGNTATLHLSHEIGQPTIVENLTVEAGPDAPAIYHEGVGSEVSGGYHEIRRVILTDNGELGGNTAGPALLLGDDVYVHDVLVHGGFKSCVHFGPRSSASSATPPSHAYVDHLTCRLTLPDADTVAAFEVAAVDGAIIANIAVELPEAGPLFRAQRRSSGDTDPDNALDKPTSFHAEAIATDGVGATYDGFTDLDGTYTLISIDPVGGMETLFVSASDSHLDPSSIALDSGIDPSSLDNALSLQVSLDGVDRSGMVPDRGCYEQGL
jgi:hypothetical protein